MSGYEPTLRSITITMPKQLERDLGILHERAKKTLGEQVVSKSFEDFLVSAIITGARVMVNVVMEHEKKNAVVLVPGTAMNNLPPIETPQNG